MNNKIIAIIILVILGAGIFYFANSYEAPVGTGTEVLDTQDVDADQFSDDMMDPNSTSTVSQAKINIDEVCQGALAYMSFPNGEAAAQFVADCKEGKHPEVIERFITELNMGSGAQI